MTQDLDRLIDAYLDGELDGADSRDFEHRLATNGVGPALGEELLVRDWLEQLGPDAPPAELVARLEASVSGPMPAPAEEKVDRLAGVRGALAGFGWLTQGPALALEAAGAGVGGGRTALRGMGLDAPIERTAKPAKKSKPIGRRLAGAAWDLAPVPGRDSKRKKSKSVGRRMAGAAWKLVKG